MKRVLLAAIISAAATAVLAGCAGANIRPVKTPKSEPVYVGDKSCMVQDYDNATEVPEGSKNLGWVSVPFTGEDETTYIELRKKICELGGDALSQPAWVRGPSDDTPALKANAWSLP